MMQNPRSAKSAYQDCVRQPLLMDLTHAFCGISTDLMNLILHSKLHEIFKSDRSTSLRLPGQHHLQITTNSDERPVIYAAVICTDKGSTPTKNEWAKVIDTALEYCDMSAPTANNTSWTQRDRLAYSIDESSPMDKDRIWSSGKLKRDTQRQETAHYRRYLKGDLYVNGFNDFLEHLLKKMDCIDSKDSDQPLPWSPAYIGWTRVEGRRWKEHYKHASTSSSIL
jgi:hypothetical protein